MPDVLIAVIADRYANFASHCLSEAKKRGYGESKRKVISYMAKFEGYPNLRFYWANHNDKLVLSHVFREHYQEVHMAGPEIDEDMTELFDVLRIKNKAKAKVITR